MMNMLPTTVIFITALSQATVQPLIRIGDVARQLPDQEVAEIQRIVSHGGRNAWLLNGPRGQIADLRSVDAYLPPEFVTPDLRRGSVVAVLNGSANALALVGLRPASAGGPPTWTAMRTESYAQVAIAGRGFDRVEGDQDLNRPFRIVGQFDDAELVDLVRFVRSNPVGPPPSSGTPRGTVRGDWPVVAVVRQRDSIEIRLRKDDYSSQLVTLRKQAPGWLVIAITMVFV